MKGTGIIRRIDDLGRIVIPREVRKRLGLVEYDPLEFFVEDDMICLKKYNPETGIDRKLEELMDSITAEDCLDPETKGYLRKTIRDMQLYLKEDKK